MENCLMASSTFFTRKTWLGMTCCFLFIVPSAVGQQLFDFFPTRQNRPLMNPAIDSIYRVNNSNGELHFSIAHRSIWFGPKFPNAPSTYNLSLRYQPKNRESFWGANFLQDQAGGFRYTLINPVYGFKAKFSEKKFINLAISPSIGFFSLDLSETKFIDTAAPDPLAFEGLASSFYFQVNSGAFAVVNDYFLGVSVGQLAGISPELDLTNSYRFKPRPHYYLYVGRNFESGKSVVSTALWGKYVQAGLYSISAILQGQTSLGRQYDLLYGLGYDPFIHSYSIELGFIKGKKGNLLGVSLGLIRSLDKFNSFLSNMIELGVSYSVKPK